MPLLSLWLPHRLFLLLSIGPLWVACQSQVSENMLPEATLLKDVILVDGTGEAPQEHVNMLIRADTIAEIVPASAQAISANAEVVDMQGKTVMPLLINTHGHLGLLQGDSIDTAHYTRENIIRQLEKYQRFGVGAVLSLGSDRTPVFGLRDSSRQGTLPGALLLTAGYGFGAPGGAPPAGSGFDQVLRPTTPEQATQAMQQLAIHRPDFVKIWVDDFMGSVPKVEPEIYQAIIAEAHRHHIPVAAHVYYLEDAKKLVQAGLDVIAHSIRDQVVDDELLQMMRENDVTYVPTLSLDQYNFVYLQQPAWLEDTFFRASLEPGVLERLTSEAYLNSLAQDTKLPEKRQAFEVASQNVKKIYDAGIRVALGTDSGAQPIRAQGFSEHLELQLMHQAGIPARQVIAIATRNAAATLGMADSLGTLTTGKKASFMVLDGNPLEDISHTRNIVSIWKNGERVSSGPVAP